MIKSYSNGVNIPANYFSHAFGEKEVPQPQDAAAFGLLILNEDSISLFSKSISEPFKYSREI